MLPSQAKPSESTDHTEATCVTKNEITTVSFKWTIENFRLRCHTTPGAPIIDSTFFPADTTCKMVKWKLRVYPGGSSKKYWGCISIHLENHGVSDLMGECKLWLLDNKNNQQYCTTPQPKIVERYGAFVFDSFCLQSILLSPNNGYLPNGNLIIKCEITYISKSYNISPESYEMPSLSNARKEKLNEYIEHLFEKKELADVTLVASNGHELKAHKFVLASGSKVFAAMFEHDMEEQKLSRVSIPDIGHETLEEVLRYMYTGETSNAYEMPIDLLRAADKYDLKHLKMLCEVSVKTNVTVQKAIDTLIMADQLKINGLKSQTLDLIIKNFNAIRTSNEWNKLKGTNSYLMDDISAAFGEKLKFD